MYANPLQPCRETLVNYNSLFKVFYQISGIQFGIITLRGLKLILFVLSGIIVYYGLRKQFIKDSAYNYFLIILFFLFSYFVGPQALSYNTLVLLSCSLAVGSFGLIIRGSSWAVLGWLAAFILLYLSKFPSAFFFLLLTLGLCFDPKSEISRQGIYLYFFGLSSVLLVILFSAPDLAPWKILSRAKNYSSLQESYGLKTILLSINDRIVYFMSTLFVGFLTQNIRKCCSKKWLSHLTLLIGYSHILFLDHSIRMACLSFFFIGLSFERTNLNRQKLTFGILLFLLPFIGYLGSNNPITSQIQYYYPFLFILPLLFNSKFYENRSIALIILLSFSIHLYLEVYKTPYNLSASLSEQNTTLVIGNESLLVDQRVANRVNALREICSQGRGKDIEFAIGIPRLTGDVFLLNKTFPFRPIWQYSGLDLLQQSSFEWPDELILLQSDLEPTPLRFKALPHYTKEYKGVVISSDELGNPENITVYFCTKKP